jgi:hypothetical protein
MTSKTLIVILTILVAIPACSKQEDVFEKKLSCSNMSLDLTAALPSNINEFDLVIEYGITEVFYSKKIDSCVAVKVQQIRNLDTEGYTTNSINDYTFFDALSNNDLYTISTCLKCKPEEFKKGVEDRGQFDDFVDSYR